MELYEIEGFLRGKCLPGDLLVGESNAQYLFRKLKERDALAVENAELKARTVTVPEKVYIKDMRSNVVRWSQVIDALSEAGVAFVRDDGELIAGVRETTTTDAAIANIRAIKTKEISSMLDEKAKELDKSAHESEGFQTDNRYRFAAAMFRGFASQLRKGPAHD